MNTAATSASASAEAGARWKLDTAVAAAALLWLALLAGWRPLMLPDEGRYVGVAWEMARTGEWLVPMLDGLPYFHKPPLFYWVTAAAMQWLGPSEWAVRMAPMLGATLVGAALFAFVRRWWGSTRARAALVVLAAQPLFLLGGQFANLDMLVAGCITLTTLLLAHAALHVEQGRAYRGWLWGGYASAALGVLAKGLIGAVLPALVLVLWLVLRRRWRVLWQLVSLPGTLLFFALAAPWFVAMQSRYPDFLHYFFVVQHVQRYTGTHFNNVQPFWFYPALLLLAGLPWRPWWRTLGSRVRMAVAGAEPLRLLMVLWAGAVVVFFSLPHSKLVGYVLPALPPLAALLADACVARAPRLQRAWWAAAAVGCTCSLAVVVALTLHPQRSTRELGWALRQLAAAGEPVVMLEEFHFDLPYYARRGPMPVVAAWQSPELAQSDNWRNELLDAGRFTPGLQGAVLWLPEMLPARLCGSPFTWLVGTPEAVSVAGLEHAVRPVASVRGTALWRFEPQRDAGQAYCHGQRPAGAPAAPPH